MTPVTSTAAEKRPSYAVPLVRLEAAFAAGDWQTFVRPASDALPEFPIVTVGAEDIERLRFGHRLAAAPGSTGLARALAGDGTLIAILEAAEGGSLWHPRKVFLE